MKKGGVLHPELGAALARLGHGEVIVLADAGLALPPDIPAIHVEVSCGVPSMAQVVAAVAAELVIERAIVANEFAEWNPEVRQSVVAQLPLEPESVPHASLVNDVCPTARAIVKTGECSAFASVALVGGVSYYDDAVRLHERLTRVRRRAR